MVDYENRETNAGCTLKDVICDDATFGRIIMGELAGQVNESEIKDYFAFASGIAAAPIEFPEGDVIVPYMTATSLTPDTIKLLAGYYDNDTPGVVPGKGGHHISPYNGSAGINNLHPDFIDYIKAFFWSAWNNLQIELNITSTYRTYEQQQGLYDEYQRRLALPEGDPETCTEMNRCWPAAHPDSVSYHNVGMALDFSPMLLDGSRLNKTTSAQAWINSGIPSTAESTNLNWGGTWSGPDYDPIHVEFSNVISSTIKKEMASLLRTGHRLDDPALSLEQLGVKLV